VCAGMPQSLLCSSATPLGSNDRYMNKKELFGVGFSEYVFFDYGLWVEVFTTKEDDISFALGAVTMDAISGLLCTFHPLGSPRSQIEGGTGDLRNDGRCIAIRPDGHWRGGYWPA